MELNVNRGFLPSQALEEGDRGLSASFRLVLKAPWKLQYTHGLPGREWAHFFNFQPRLALLEDLEECFLEAMKILT